VDDVKGWMVICLFVFAIGACIDSALAETGVRRAIGLVIAIALFGVLVQTALG